MWASPSALLKLPCSWVLLGRGRLSLPLVALPLFPSLASPPPSLRSGTSPQGEFICLLGIVRAAAPVCLRLCLRIDTHEKRLGHYLCGVGFALRWALSEHRIERNGVPRPHFYFLSDNRFALRLTECVIVIWVDNRKVFRFSDICFLASVQTVSRKLAFVAVVPLIVRRSQ